MVEYIIEGVCIYVYICMYVCIETMICSSGLYCLFLVVWIDSFFVKWFCKIENEWWDFLFLKSSKRSQKSLSLICARHFKFQKSNNLCYSSTEMSM